MNDKELDNYMKTVNPNFDSHIEKGTIEMSNEYYNLLEEKMARLIAENQELKKQLEERNIEYFKGVYDTNNKYNTQQQAFIKWLEDEIERKRLNATCTTEYNDYVIPLRVVLQKYKEITGVSDEKKMNLNKNI